MICQYYSNIFSNESDEKGFTIFILKSTQMDNGVLPTNPSVSTGYSCALCVPAWDLRGSEGSVWIRKNRVPLKRILHKIKWHLTFGFSCSNSAMPLRIILHLILINAPADLIILIFPVHTWDKPEITICIDFWTTLKIILIMAEYCAKNPSNQNLVNNASTLRFRCGVQVKTQF